MTVGPRRYISAPKISNASIHPEQRATGAALSSALMAAYSYGQEAGRYASCFSQWAIGGVRAPLPLSGSAKIDFYNALLWIPSEAISVVAGVVFSVPYDDEGLISFTIDINGVAGTQSDKEIDPDGPDYPADFTLTGQGSGLYVHSVEQSVPSGAAGSRVSVRVFAESSDLGGVADHSCVVRFEYV